MGFELPMKSFQREQVDLQSVYFDRKELSKRPWLYALTPLVSFAVAWFVYREGAAVFWRVLAYMAVFHFVRQQYGWMARGWHFIGGAESWRLVDWCDRHQRRGLAAAYRDQCDYAWSPLPRASLLGSRSNHE